MKIFFFCYYFRNHNKNVFGWLTAAVAVAINHLHWIDCSGGSGYGGEEEEEEEDAPVFNGLAHKKQRYTPRKEQPTEELLKEKTSWWHRSFSRLCSVCRRRWPRTAQRRLWSAFALLIATCIDFDLQIYFIWWYFYPLSLLFIIDNLCYVDRSVSCQNI